MTNSKFKYYELILLVLVWVLLIASPFFFNEKEYFEWNDLIGPLYTIIPLFFIFLINRFILVPKLLYKKKSLYYLISVAALIAVFSLGLYLFTNAQNRRPPQQMDQQWRPPPPPPGNSDKRLPPLPQPERGGRPIPPFANLLIFSLLLVGFDTGLMTTFRLVKSERKRDKLEKENAETKLALLRNQVSPHFFMNTLNNIHSLIDINTEEAKEAIIRLSKLMRYLLYESETTYNHLAKELEFIRSYVNLMKLRFPDRIKITLSIPEQIPDIKIPPLIFTSLLENAFKHGISYDQESFIDVRFIFPEGQLYFETQNSIHKSEEKNSASGIGIENTRERLDLLYKENYSLDISEDANIFTVKLTIPT